MANKQHDNTKTDTNLAEEAAFLRQKCSSLVMRGHYAESAKLIEDNIQFLYTGERWPENFFSALKIFQRCYPALNHNETLEEYTSKLLKKNTIPFVFAGFLREGKAPVKWNAEYFRDRAVELRASRDFETALGYCDIALKIDPASSNLYLFRGWILEDMGKLSDAAKMAEQALELNKSNLKAGQTLSRIYTGISLGKALAFTERMIGEYPEEDFFVAEKAAVLLKMGKNAEALRFYDTAAGLSPYNAEYPYQMAEIYTLQRDETAALLYYKRAVTLDPNHIPSLLRLAFLHENKQPSAALDYITSYLTAEPENIDAMLLRGRLLIRLGDRWSAITQFEGILETNPNNAAALSGAAFAYLPEDSFKAAGYFSRALEADPNNTELLMGRARAYLRMDRNSDAINDYKAVTRIDKNNSEAFGKLAELCREADPKTALDYISRAVGLNSDNPGFQSERAHVLLKLNRVDDAIVALDTAVALEPGNAVLRCELGLLLQKTGNGASAVKNLKEAVNADPRLDNAFHALAELLMYSRPDEALKYIDKAIKQDALNASHFYVKSLIISQLGADSHARENLSKYASEIYDDTMLSQLNDIIQGKYLTVALVYIDRAVSLSQNNNLYLCEQARLFYSFGHYKKALELFQGLLKDDPNNHGALFGMGSILAHKKDEKALEYFDKAITISPDTAAYYIGKAAFISKKEDKYEEALVCYDKALRLDTYNHYPALDKGKLMESRSDISGAMASYRRTLLINPNCFDAAARMGRLLAPLRPDNALNYIEQAIFLAPGDYSLRMWKALALFGQGRSVEAAAECEAALSMVENPGKGCYELAMVLGDNFPREALAFAQSAAGMDGSPGEYHTLCGKLCLKLEDYIAARSFFETALKSNPKDSEAALLNTDILYRLRLPESVEAAQSLKDSPAAAILKAKTLAEIADPPRTKEAVSILADAVKRFPDELSLREEYVAILGKTRSLIKYPAEKARLERLRSKIKSSAIIIDAEEIEFKPERDETGVTGNDTASSE